MKLGSNWLMGFRLTLSKLRNPEMRVVGAPPL